MPTNSLSPASRVGGRIAAVFSEFLPSMFFAFLLVHLACSSVVQKELGFGLCPMFT